MCKDSRPDAAKQRNALICEYSEKLEKGDEETLEMMTSNLHKKLQDIIRNIAYFRSIS